jgi:hypothetical protein
MLEEHLFIVSRIGISVDETYCFGETDRHTHTFFTRIMSYSSVKYDILSHNSEML